jgi:RNA polymerase sigma-54 factor
MLEGSQKQRQQLTLRQRSYLATRGVILEQPLGDFEPLIDRFVSESVIAEKHTRATATGDSWNGDLDSLPAPVESDVTDYIVGELLEQGLIDEPELQAAEFLVSDLDEHGFFAHDVSDYSRSNSLRETDVQKTLRGLQALNVAGLGATDVAHCFALQLARVVPNLPVEQCASLLRVRAASVSPGVLRACLKKLGLPSDANLVQKALAVLDPEPLKHLIPAQARIVVPDIVIERDPVDGHLVCTVPQPTWGLTVDPDVLASAREDPQARRRVITDVTKARWVEEGIVQRTRTLTMIGEALIRQLAPFLAGESDSPSQVPTDHLMRDTGLSRTVLARAISRKYVATPRGTFRLRSLVMDHWETASAPAKDALARLLQSGDASREMSDRQISEYLATQGIRVSRRTVAKYRLSLGIPARYFRRN